MAFSDLFDRADETPAAAPYTSRASWPAYNLSSNHLVPVGSNAHADLDVGVSDVTFSVEFNVTAGHTFGITVGYRTSDRKHLLFFKQNSNWWVYRLTDTSVNETIASGTGGGTGAGLETLKVTAIGDSYEFRSGTVLLWSGTVTTFTRDNSIFGFRTEQVADTVEAVATSFRYTDDFNRLTIGSIGPNGADYQQHGTWSLPTTGHPQTLNDLTANWLVFDAYTPDAAVSTRNWGRGILTDPAAGVVARYVDDNNFVAAVLRNDEDVHLVIRVAGVETEWATCTVPPDADTLVDVDIVLSAVGNVYTLTVQDTVTATHTDVDNNFLTETRFGLIAWNGGTASFSPLTIESGVRVLLPDALHADTTFDGTGDPFTGTLLPPIDADAVQATARVPAARSPGIVSAGAPPAHAHTPATTVTIGVPSTILGGGFTVRASCDPDGINAAVYGHRPADAFDMSFDAAPDAEGNFVHQYSYWLSEGYDEPTGGNAYPWIECNAHNSEVNLVYLHPWAGHYLVYVSVWEGGTWVPPEDSGQGGIVPTSDPDAAIPYVTSFGTSWEGGLPQGTFSNQYPLPRVYMASKIRLTFTNLTLSQEGGYRAGARKIMPQLDKTLAFLPALCFTCCPYPSSGEGYWQARCNGNIYPFGDAATYPPNGASTYTTYAGWLIAINATPTGAGYWGLDMFGRIVSHGDAGFFGDLSATGRSDVVDFAPTPSGSGYWLLCRDGTVHSFGDAVHHGDAAFYGFMPSGSPIAPQGIESHPSSSGYWILLSDGVVQVFNLTDHGSANRDGFGTTEYVHSIRRTSTGNGYWIPSGSGIVQAFGDAPHLGNASPYPVPNWAYGLIWDFIPNWSTNAGYALQHADGKLDRKGDFTGLEFGSVGDGYGVIRKAGNYKDYADIIKELLLWSGFYLYRWPEPHRFPDVYGNIETTGAFSTEELPPDMFDKRAPMDAITQLKEIVGYIFYIDDEGGARFEAPNWWGLGNFDYLGASLDIMPEIDEELQLTEYKVQFHDAEARSEITIASEQPLAAPGVLGHIFPDATLITRIRPPSADDLKGLIRPAIWSNGVFMNAKEQKVMAELIALHIWFARRTGSVSCFANPLIGINDQVRIFERQTGETYIHYVRGVNTTHDLETGAYTMNLDTHWLGGALWNIQPYYFAIAGRPQGDGYWQVNAEGSVYAFGAADLYDKNEPESQTEVVISIRSTHTGLGYYTLGMNGKVLTHGDAVHYGDLFEQSNDVADMAITPSGHGYWILHVHGEVNAFGDAVHHGSASVTGTMPSGLPVLAESIESHPDTQGYWILLSDGTVSAHNLPDHGSANRDGFGTTEYVGTLRRTDTGDGYWIPSGSGIVQAFGDATFHGNAPDHHTAWHYALVWDMVPGIDGYVLQHADGAVDVFGSYPNYGDARSGSTAKQQVWALISADDTDAASTSDSVAVSADVLQFLANTESKATAGISTQKFQEDGPATQKART